ncbi:MAG: hypothetical protein ABJ021_15055 [Nitratireductor sp.]
MQAKMVSFGVQPAVYAGLEQRGRTMGLAPGKYAQRLFEAAYAARCLAERGEASGDAALDRHVRQVFLLADCEPEFIAGALAMPQARVERILAGWKIAAKSPPQPPAEEDGAATAKPAASAPVRGLAKTVTSTRWTDQDRLMLKDMWAQGRTVPEIAAALGRAETAVQQYASSHRGLCPKRRA